MYPGKTKGLRNVLQTFTDAFKPFVLPGCYFIVEITINTIKYITFQDNLLN